VKKNKSMTALLGLALLTQLTLSAWAQKNPKDQFDFPPLNPLKIPPVKQVTLKNGIRLFLIEDNRFPTIDMAGVLAGGSAFEPADKAGLASLTGTVLRTGGTRNMTGDELDRELESMAASIETGFGDTSGSIAVSMLKENADRVLSLLADILEKPVFSQDKLDLAKIEARTAISRRNDDIGQIADREFSKVIFGPASPYARQAEYATIDAVGRADLVAFYRRFVHPDNLWLAVWGDFETGRMAKKIEASLGGWRRSGVRIPPPPPVDYEFKKTVNYIEKTDASQSNIIIGHIGGLLNNPDHPAIAIMNQILSWDRLFKIIRTNEGLAYDAHAEYNAGFRVPGLFRAVIQTKSGSTFRGIQLILQEIQRITRDPVSDEEIQRAKDLYMNSHVFQFDSRAKIINRMLILAFSGYPLDFSEQLFKKIESVTKADILNAAQKYLKPGLAQILVVGKKDDFDRPLSELGPVSVLDISIPVPKAESHPEATRESLDKGREIFSRAVAAMGDPEKIRGIKNAFTRATLVQGGAAMEAEMTLVYPDKFRISINTPGGKIDMIVNGRKGIIKTPQGAMPLPETEKQSLVDEILRDPIYIWQNFEKYEVQSLGSRKAGDKETIDLLVSGPVDPFHVYLDPRSLLIVGAAYQSVTPQGPEMVEIAMSDYREVEGILTAFRSESSANQKTVAEQTVRGIAFNTEVSDDLFKIE